MLCPNFLAISPDSHFEGLDVELSPSSTHINNPIPEPPFPAPAADLFCPSPGRYLGPLALLYPLLLLWQIPGQRAGKKWISGAEGIPWKTFSCLSVRSMDRNWRIKVWDLHPKAKQLPQVWWGWAELALGKLWGWTWSQFLSHLQQGWTLQCRMSCRENIPTLAEGWMQWSNHGWDQSLSCAGKWQWLHFPSSNTTEAQPELSQMSPLSEKPGRCSRDLWTAAFCPWGCE